MNLSGVNSTSQEQIDGISDRIARGRVPSWKRVLDCTFVLITLPLWLPVGVVVALFVKIVSPGPALFRQERIGHMGARFRCLKFRTMKVNADTTVHREHLNHLMTSGRPMKKLDSTGDSRLIPGGLWLRTLGIDELPQLINVLCGDMSLVGPRPTTGYEYEMFQPRHRRRCETLPGLTGLWQVNGKNRTTFERMMELDIEYVEKKSLWLDLQILARTGPAILIQLWDVKIAGKFAAKPARSKDTESVLAQNGQRGSVSGKSSLDTTQAPTLAATHRTGFRAAPEPIDG
jgi:lipopolysaccharide/colanic/teichoic acid biosynthesis glycosyltransferase